MRSICAAVADSSLVLPQAAAPATGFTYDSKFASTLVRNKPDNVWVVSICSAGASNCGAQVKMSGFRRFNRRRL
jgi:hypothetical protein